MQNTLPAVFSLRSVVYPALDGSSVVCLPSSSFSINPPSPSLHPQRPIIFRPFSLLLIAFHSYQASSIENPGTTFCLCYFVPRLSSFVFGLLSVVCRLYSVFSLLFSATGLSTFVENLRQTSPFYSKQTQFPKCTNELKYLLHKGI